MSGGYFDYVQYRIFDSAEQIEKVIASRDEYNYSDEIIFEFERAIRYLNLAATYLHKVDWLLEGDDGEDTFHRRLKEDLTKLVGEGEGE